MVSVLITGMSGSGKSSVVEALAGRGHDAYDLDSAAWSAWVACEGDPTGACPGHDWLWDEAKLAALLAGKAGTSLFVSGCASNMGKFVAGFDRIVLLSAPVDVLLRRVRARTNNPYGKREEEVARIRANWLEFEPKLRRLASHEIDASRPLRDVVEDVLQTAFR